MEKRRKSIAKAEGKKKSSVTQRKQANISERACRKDVNDTRPPLRQVYNSARALATFHLLIIHAISSTYCGLPIDYESFEKKKKKSIGIETVKNHPHFGDFRLGVAGKKKNREE